MNEETPQTPEAIPHGRDLVARLVNQDSQVLAIGRVQIDDGGLCHFYSTTPEVPDTEALDGARMDLGDFGIHTMFGLCPSGELGGGCRYHFRLKSTPQV